MTAIPRPSKDHPLPWRKRVTAGRTIRIEANNNAAVVTFPADDPIMHENADFIVAMANFSADIVREVARCQSAAEEGAER